MKTIWIALAGASLASLGCSAAHAGIYTIDIQYWSGIGSPPANPDVQDFAHIVVDDSLGGAISNHDNPTGIWTYGHGSYFGLPYVDFDIDIYNDYWGGGFTFVPFSQIDGNPDYDYMLDIWGLSALTGEPGDYHLAPGTYDLDGGYDGLFRVTVSEATTAVPEPAAWAMMVGGFGVIGAAMRRRQRTSVSFG